MLIAFILDWILGDPQWLPHPVRWMGKAIAWGEPRFRRIPIHPIVTGGIFALVLILGTWGIAMIFLFVAQLIHPLLKTVIEIIMMFYCISVQSLRTSALDVYDALKRRNLDSAKYFVSRIVGRDTNKLSDKGIIRATIETVAENLVDGVISPLFYIAIGGAPLGLAYKMVNTLDSMIGYQNEIYKDFGKIAARIDDVANYIPARISIFIVAISAQILCRNGKLSLKTGFKEGKNHTSPNSGYSEAAFAGALGIKLGGPNTYKGVLVSKPYIGAQFGEVHIEHIVQACDIMLLSSILWVFICIGGRFFV